MASQSGTRYEDRTMQRPGGTAGTGGGQVATSTGSSHHHMNNSTGGYSVRVCQVIVFIKPSSCPCFWVGVQGYGHDP